jgi:aminoglycoside phosphotransferase (APT) family kinase protein
MNELFYVYESPKKAFVHTDIQWKNIIYDPKNGKISWIIDFTDSKIWWIELDFCYFYNVDESLLRKMIKLYKWFEDEEFFKRVFFLARRWVIFEIDNDELYEKDFDYILWELKKYKFM